MHEIALSFSLLSIVLREAQAVGAKQVQAVTIQAGEYAAVNEQALTFAWNIATEGTAAEGAQLNLQLSPGGRDLIIASMEVTR